MCLIWLKCMLLIKYENDVVRTVTFSRPVGLRPRALHYSTLVVSRLREFLIFAMYPTTRLRNHLLKFWIRSSCLFWCLDLFVYLARTSFSSVWLFLDFKSCGWLVFRDRKLFLITFPSFYFLTFYQQGYNLWFRELSACLVKII